jgi:prepilin-type N-terminal cleavage/methylation domain-containing protein/prepilin-type processing-associated H-X9-DG protein
VRKKGFTLIELLVVISIIALLLSILMPGLQLAKAKAKNLLCSTNVKGIITAWHMYSGDNGEKLCSPLTRHTPPDPSDPIKNQWVWGPTEKMSDGTGNPIPYSAGSFEPTEAERKEGLRRGALWPYLETVDVFHCQSDKSKNDNFRSYSMTDSMNGVGGWASTDYKIYRSQGEIRNPAGKIVLLEENDSRGCNFGSFIMEPVAQKWADPLTVWHGGTSSFAFADGHAEFRKWDPETVENFMADPPVHGYFPTTDGGIEDIKWMQKGWSRPIGR